MTSDPELLERLLAGTDPAALLPARRSDEAVRIEQPLSLVACTRLDETRTDHCYLIVRDARGVSYGAPCVVEGTSLRRARPGDGAADGLVRLLSAERQSPSVGAFSVTRWHGERCSGERGIDVDQTNELVVVGERAVVKWLLHPTPDEQPAPRRLAALAEAHFTGTPRPWGLVSIDVAGADVLIATVIDFVADAEDGWDWAVNDVRGHARGETDMATAVGSIPVIGRLVAEMHLAFAAHGGAAASNEDVEAWRSEALDDLRGSGLGDALGAVVEPEIFRIGEFEGVRMIDIHGDLHIGQVLRVAGSQALSIIDFDGNPTLTPQQRLARQPPARDVAGMLASLDHVGRVVLHRTEGLDHDERDRVLAWIVEAQRLLVEAYVSRLVEQGQGALFEPGLVRPFQLQQECREFIYAARYLPHWRYVPEAALAALIGGVQGRPSGRDDEGAP